MGRLEYFRSSREFHTQQSLEFSQKGVKKQKTKHKNPTELEALLWAERMLLMRELRREGAKWSEQTGRI